MWIKINNRSDKTMSIDEEIEIRLAIIDENTEKILSLLEKKESKKSNLESDNNRLLENETYGGL